MRFSIERRDMINDLIASLLAGIILNPAIPVYGVAERQVTVVVRGKPQVVHLYGPASGPPVLVASGDGGWVHLGVHVAEVLGGKGYFVVGVDSKAYLSSFTGKDLHLTISDVPRDFRLFIDEAQRGKSGRVLLFGVSEGAGLSILAASDPDVGKRIEGIIGFGLPNQNEIGWHFFDSIIWLTHKSPNEPSFLVADFIPKLGPIPLAEIHSTRDEYVPVNEAKQLMSLPGGPKKMWIIDAENHRFSNNLVELNRRLEEAIQWIKAQRH